jgi:hypothetical protein
MWLLLSEKIDYELFNFDCRLVLRCRQDARVRFAKMRSDVLVKIELLDQKHGMLEKML